MQGRSGGHIAPVGHGMNGHRHTLGHNGAGGGQHMFDMTMHPTVGNDAHQMRYPARGFHRMNETHQGGIGCKRSILNRQINRAQIHRHHPARADIGVTYFGIAHLPGGQANIGAMGDQFGLRTGGHQTVKIGNMGQRRGIGERIGALAPAIQNTQDHGFRMAHHRHSLIRNPHTPASAQGEPDLAIFFGS